MLFAIDGEVFKRSAPAYSDLGEYTFKSVVPVSEDKMFKQFKKNKSLSESMYNLNDSREYRYIRQNDPVTMQMAVNRVPVNSERPPFKIPFKGVYIIPKMYEYFPFLDCDSAECFENVKFNLALDNIPYKSYKSNYLSDSYWILCDRQCPLDEAIEFIETYPADHRYSWIAKEKQELCIRAAPKGNWLPTLVDEHLDSEFTNDFKYFTVQFEDYWKHGKIIEYLEMIKTVESL